MDVYKVSRLGRCRDFKSLQTIFITINDSAVFCGCQDFEFFNEIKVYGLKRSVYSVLLRSVAVYWVENVQKRILWWDFFCVALIRLTCYFHSRLVPSLLLSFVAVVGRSRVTSTAFRRRERRPTGRKERKRARESSPLAPSHHPLRVSLSRIDSRSFSLPSLPNPPPFPPYFPPLPLLTPATQASSPYKKRLENLRVRYFQTLLQAFPYQ